MWGQGVGVRTMTRGVVARVVVLTLAASTVVAVDGYVRGAGASASGVTIEGAQLLLNGRPFYPRGFNMVGLLQPDGCTKGAGAARKVFGERELLAARDDWAANTVRFQVSQRGLDPQDPIYRASYVTRIADGVALARRLGFVVVVSMQDQSLGCGDTHPLPSAATERSWRSLAPLLRTDPHIVAELFNEPDNDVTDAGWAQWRNGGTSPLANLGAPAVGHQQLLETLRALGVSNVVLADGARKSARFTGIPLLSDQLPQAQVGYSVHPYYFHNFATATLAQDRSGWESRFGFMAERHVLLATEWNTRLTSCTAGGDARAPDLLAYLREKNIGLLGQAFDIPDTMVRNITDWPPTTLAGYGCNRIGPDAGQLVQDHFRELAGIDVDRQPGAVVTSPASGSAVANTFAVSATAADDGVVTRMLLHVDGVQHSEFSFTPARNVAATTRLSLPAGRHLLTAVAYDSASPQPQSFTSVPVEVDVAALPDCSGGPTSPQDVSTSATNQRVRLAWRASSVPDGCPEVTGYRVLRALDDGSALEPVGVTAGISFADDGVAPGSTYRYVVEAYDAAGVSARSDAVVASVPEAACAEALPVPTGLRLESASYTSLTIAWAAVDAPAACGLDGYRVFRDGVAVATVPAESYVDSRMSAGEQHRYTVAAVDETGTLSAQSAEFSAASRSDDLAPVTPGGVNAAQSPTTPSSRIDLRWFATNDLPDPGGTGVSSYRVYRADRTGGPLATVPAASTAYADLAVSANRSYSYRLTAVDAAGNESASSVVVTAATAPGVDTVRPSAPGSVTARALMPAQVRITWTRSTDTGGSGLAGYAVYRSGRTAPLRVLNDPTATEFLDTTTAAGTSYTYRVEAFDGRNNRSVQASAPTVRTPRLNDSVRPAAPKGLTVTSVSGGSVSFRWGAVTDGGSGIAGYHVYRGGVHVGDGVGTSYTDRGLRPATRYTYTVIAYDRAANNSLASAALSVRTASAAVDGDAATGTGSGRTFA